LVPFSQRYRDAGLSRTQAYRHSAEMEGVVRLGSSLYVLLEQWPHAPYDGRCPGCGKPRDDMDVPEPEEQGTPGYLPASIAAKIEEQPGEDGCWLWLGSCNQTGYPIASDPDHGGRSVNAARFIFERLIGKVPPGRWLERTCLTRACVRPGHLRPSLPAEVNQRTVARRKQWRDGGPDFDAMVREIEAGGPQALHPAALAEAEAQAERIRAEAERWLAEAEEGAS